MKICAKFILNFNEMDILKQINNIFQEKITVNSLDFKLLTVK